MFKRIRAAMRSRRESGEVMPMRLSGAFAWEVENVSREAQTEKVAPGSNENV